MSSDAVSDLPFRQLAQHLPTPCWISDAEGRITWVNDAWLAYTGKDPEALAAEGLAVLHDPQVLPEVARRWADAKAAGQPAEMVFPLRGRDGTLRPFLTRVVPLRDPDGRITRWFGTNTDISRQAEAEARARESEASLHENEARLRLATEAAGVGVWEWRLATNEMIYSPQAKAICGFAPDQPVTYEMVAAVTHPDDFPRTSAQAERALDPQVRDRSAYEYRILRADGTLRWVSAAGEAVFVTGPDGREVAERYVGVLLDITERKATEERLTFLAREVDHRANNLMSIVQSVVALSHGDSAEELREVISGRVYALARAHQLLAAARWTGADLRRLVDEELLPFSLGAPSPAVAVEGPPIGLDPTAAQGVSMVLHELATNAAKHGALSRPGGRVDVSWRADPDRGVVVRWVESGGPPVTAPARQGFGTSVIARALGGAIGGDAILDWRLEGLVCELVIPLREPAEAAAVPQPRQRAGSDA